MGMILLGVVGEATLPAINHGQFWHREHEILPGVAGEEVTLPAVNCRQFWPSKLEMKAKNRYVCTCCALLMVSERAGLRLLVISMFADVFALSFFSPLPLVY